MDILFSQASQNANDKHPLVPTGGTKDKNQSSQTTVFGINQNNNSSSAHHCPSYADKANPNLQNYVSDGTRSKT